MKRRNAILLGLVFLMMIAGYLAWCWRGFYLTTPFKGYMRDEHLVLVQQWRAKNPGWDDVPFNGRLALRMLMRPWYDYRGVVVATISYNTGESMVCMIQHTVTRRHTALRFANADGTWKLDGEF